MNIDYILGPITVLKALACSFTLSCKCISFSFSFTEVATSMMDQ